MMMEIEDMNTSSRWVKLLYYLWKIFTCLFLHVLLITIVVSYCYFGSYMFKKLEEGYEKNMKKNITEMRRNVSYDIWKYTDEQKVLYKANWTDGVRKRLQFFEDKLVDAMRKGGWNGNDNETALLWTSDGALFYSVIVITTIGYGHIAPKTETGKIATIFYAVVGIPLMLLCLSNIGDLMAHSFRFLYWRICCYKCTQPPKRIPLPPRRIRSFRNTIRSHGNRVSVRSRPTSFRYSGRTSQKSADSAIGMSEGYTRSSYSDTECRYYDEMDQEGGVPPKSFNRQSQQSRYSDNVFDGTYPLTRHSQHSSYRSRMAADSVMAEFGGYMAHNSPVVPNRYALELEESRLMRHNREKRYRRTGRNQLVTVSKDDSILYRPSTRRDIIRGAKNEPMLGSERRLASTGISTLPTSEFSPRQRRERPHSTSSLGRHTDNIGPSPRIMSPLGFAVHRQTFPRTNRDHLVDDYFDYYYDYCDYYRHDYTKPVPIWLCVFLVISYIIGGAFLFNQQEDNWGFFNSAYFCFITLTTIGFGDYVPHTGIEDNKEIRMGTAICSLYLLFGIALLAMSFNLVQEEVINNVKSVARHLGIIKDEDEDE